MPFPRYRARRQPRATNQIKTADVELKTSSFNVMPKEECENLRKFIEKDNWFISRDPMNYQDYIPKDAFLRHRILKMAKRFIRFFYHHMLYYTLGPLAYPFMLLVDNYTMLQNCEFSFKSP